MTSPIDALQEALSDARRMLALLDGITLRRTHVILAHHSPIACGIPIAYANGEHVLSRTYTLFTRASAERIAFVLGRTMGRGQCTVMHVNDYLKQHIAELEIATRFPMAA